MPECLFPKALSAARPSRFFQQPNGYWHGEVIVTAPKLATPYENSNGAFHDAGDALHWARAQIEFVVIAA